MNKEDKERLRKTFADALANCEMLDDKKRNDIVGELPEHISRVIERRDNTIDDFRKIVGTCSNFSEGVEKLLKAVEGHIGTTIFWEAIKEAGEALKQELSPSRGAEAPIPLLASSDERKFALVVGVNRYESGQEAGRQLKSHQFTNLKYAAADAMAIHGYLRGVGYLGPDPLIDEQATRRGILRAIDELHRTTRCSDAKNPLVVVFFSGHGATDEDGRPYLVPYDGRRDELFATALWNKTFDAALDEIETNRLVVFLDACHAGAVGLEGVKGAGLLEYDPATLAKSEPTQADAAARRRHVVASCKAGQVSHEGEGSGIFTGHLLRLLRCDRPEFFESEQVTLWDLYKALKLDVETTALKQYNATQEPYSNVDRATHIVMAVNAPRREARIKHELAYIKAINQFVDGAGIKVEKMLVPLEMYVQLGESRSELKRFFNLFREQASEWRPGDCESVGDLFKQLKWVYDRSTTGQGGATLPPTAPRESGTRAAARPQANESIGAGGGDQFATSDAVRTLNSDHGAYVRSAPQTPAAQSATKRRLLSDADRAYVCEPICNVRNMKVERKLEAFLKQPKGVEQAEIEPWLVKAGPAEEADLDEWEAAANTILARFREKWPTSPEVEMRNVFDLRAGGDIG